MTTRRAIVLAFALLFLFAMANLGCSDKADTDNADEVSGTITPAETGDASDSDTIELSDHEGWLAGDWGVVAVLDINFRTAPSAESPRVSGYPVLYYKTLVEVMDVQGDWINVRYEGANGWLVTEYEGNEYIRKAKRDDLGNKTSDAFIKTYEREIKDWATDAKVHSLYGSDAAFNGTAGNWTGFFIADSKPGKKLFVSAERIDEWLIDDFLPPEMRGEVVAPGPPYSFFLPYAGPDNPISSDEICTYRNIATFLASEPVTRNKTRMKEKYEYWDIVLALTEGNWVVVIDQLPYHGISGKFDAKTGKYLGSVGILNWEDEG